MRYNFFFLVIFLLLLAVFFPVFWVDKLQIGNRVFEVVIVDNEESRYRGLSGYEKLPNCAGMLFVHDTPGRYKYVMRGMKFDLDFVFIKEDVVIDIVKNVSKNNPQKIIEGDGLYNMILEVPAGCIDDFNIKVNMKVRRFREFRL